MSAIRLNSALRVLALGLGALLPWSGCGGDDGGGSASNQGGSGTGGADASNGGTGGSAGSSTGATGGLVLDGSSDGLTPCGDAGCSQGQLCKYSVCIPSLGSCSSPDDCPGDSYCDTDGICVPYGIPPGKINDPTCEKSKPSPGVAPVVQCEWSSSPAGDPTLDYVDVYTAPMVAELNLDLDKNKIQPSIVLTTFTSGPYSRVGMLRVFDGRTCAEQMRIGGPDDPEAASNRPGYGTNWAIGDLDGDVGVSANGHPEIVGLHRVGLSSGSDPLQPIAFAIDSTGPAPKLVRKWLGRTCPGDQPVTFATNTFNYGPGLWDLDDDGKPEVVIDSMVFDSNGCFLNPPAQNLDYIQLGVLSTVADVDLDGKPELVRYDGVYAWNTSTKKWELETWFTQSAAHKPGHVAVVNLGEYSSIPGKTATDPLPEIVVVSAESNTFSPQSSGTVRVQTLSGQTVFGPLPLYKKTSTYGGHGGPPTASDFDGDGQVELAAAANEFYVVYDPDCTGAAPPAERPGGKCEKKDATLPTGILWAQPSQDFSSSSTGSSIFDFDGDGKSEAVYGDECYVRVYDGKSGTVLFSASASTGTGYELPVVADVDGDFATEIVASRSSANLSCPSPDPLFAASGAFEKKGGFIVLRDPEDRWVASRPIWNQHAYSITHVTDDGRVPKSSQVLRNWEQPGMNNFRQNAQGALGKLALADLTVELDNLAGLCDGQTKTLEISAKVCNRGTNPVQDGAEIAFYQAPKADGGLPDGAFDDGGVAELVCKTVTPKLLLPGDCTIVKCTGQIQGDKDVYVVADPSGAIADCHPGNNVGAGTKKLCPTVQ